MSPVPAPADRRFRRAHTKPSRRRGKWQTAFRKLVRSGLLIALALYGVYRVTEGVMGSGMLRIDRIEVEGNRRMPDGEVFAVLDGLRGENIVTADLEAWRRRLLASPWVREAELRRFLPSTIAVTMAERTPIAVARIRDVLYLVDERGAVIDLYGPQYADFDLPIVDGLSAAVPPPNGVIGEVTPSTDEVRAALAAQVLLDLQAKPELSRRVSQVDVSDRYNVALTLAGDPAVIYIGHERFLPRLQSYVELAAALRERVPDIVHVDLRFDDRIYVRPAGSRRTSAASVSAANRPVSARRTP